MSEPNPLTSQHFDDGSMSNEALQHARQALRQEPGSLACVTTLCQLLAEAAASDPSSSIEVKQTTRIEAEQAWRGLVEASPTHMHVLAAARQWEAWQETPRQKARPLRLALIGTGTLQTLAAYVRVGCAGIGMHPQLWVGEFNQWMQELLAENSRLYHFAPEVVAVCVAPQTLFPQTMGGTLDGAQAERNEGIEQLASAIRVAAHRLPNATFIVHTFATPDYAPHGIRDLWQGGGQRAIIERLNQDLLEQLREHVGQNRILVVDQERLEARYGKRGVRDERLWYLASVPFADAFLPTLTSEYVRLLRPLLGLSRKCIVLDLDNTLWGGVVGEDKLEHLKLGGSSAPGNAFYDFQQYLLHLQQERGILLTLCSKNNEDDVWPVLENHPDMILRRSSFVAVRVNWETKPTNVRSIAHELNIGLDSMVFLDDNPAERALMRQEVPEVLTVEMPRDPALYVKTVKALDVFEVVQVTEEDRRRVQLYQQQQARKSFEIEQRQSTVTNQQSPENLTAYLQNLEMKVQIATATGFTLPRIAQLINKTNQFNTTTRRYTEAQVQTMMEAPNDWSIYSVTVSDRFGDSGLTGVVILRKKESGSNSVWEVDSFLLSCRILGRGVEDALLAFVVQQAGKAGVSVLRASFLPTAKNEPARGFFGRHGWAKIPTEDTSELYELSPLSSPDFPSWLAVHLETAKPSSATTSPN